MWIDLRTGYRCNQACRFCDQGDRRDRFADAPTDAIVALLRAHVGEAEGVWLAGGEVTARPDLPRLVAAAREAGFSQVGIQTNGRVLAAPGAAASLRRAGLTHARVGLHAATPGLHDWLVRAEGAWKQAAVGIRRLVDAGVATRVTTVLTRTGASELPALAELPGRLGAEGHRWIFAREEGAAAVDARMLVPRYSLVRGPLRDAVARAWEARHEVETVGVPLCQLGPARAAAADLRAEKRVFPVGMDEAARGRRYGPPCAGCPVRSACPGVDAAYADRYGWEEIAPPEPIHVSNVSDVSFKPDRVILSVEAECPLACASCAARRAYGDTWPTEPERALRQRLVRAAGEGAGTVVFAGASPWAHPGLPAVIREARRLGFAGIEVWGPIEPLDTLTEATAERLAGLTRVRAPRLGAEAGEGAAARFAEAERRFALLLPGVTVEVYEPGPVPTAALYRADGPRAVWGSCQREG